MTSDDIQNAYDTLGYELGWFFMLTPASRVATAPVITVGLNPGGSEPEPPSWEYDGNAYIDADWTRGGGPTPLQRQIRILYELAGIVPDEVMAGQFVPFRSPSWAKLKRRDAAVEFGRELWTWVLSQSPAKLIVCFGRKAAWEIAQLTGARQTARAPTGWGATHFVRYDDGHGRIIIDLPHPSRYQVFGRKDGLSKDAEHHFRQILDQWR